MTKFPLTYFPIKNKRRWNVKEKTRFIKRLEEMMSEKGYTQQKLAELLNISQTAISNYLRGDRKPNYEMILLIGGPI